jgi:hypothetical protein
MRLLAYALALTVIFASALIMWPRTEGMPSQPHPPGQVPIEHGALATKHGEVERGVITLFIASLVRQERADLLLRRD